MQREKRNSIKVLSGINGKLSGTYNNLRVNNKGVVYIMTEKQLKREGK